MFLLGVMTSSRIPELASIISSNTIEVDGYLSTHSLPPLSIELNKDSQDDTFSDRIQRAQNAVLEVTDELHAYMPGPLGIFMWQTECLPHFVSQL